MREVGVDVTNEFPEPWTDEIHARVERLLSSITADA